MATFSELKEFVNGIDLREFDDILHQIIFINRATGEEMNVDIVKETIDHKRVGPKRKMSGGHSLKILMKPVVRDRDQEER